MKVLFWGTPEFAVPPLRALAEEGHAVVAVVTQPDRPAGRGRVSRPSPVKIEADAESIPVREGELQVSLFALLEALRRVLEHVPKESAHHQVTLERVTLQDRMLHVMDLLTAAAEGTVLFADLLADGATSLHRVVVTFLAILELAKIRALRLFQNVNEIGVPFGPVRVRAAVPPDAASIEAAALDAEGETDV